MGKTYNNPTLEYDVIHEDNTEDFKNALNEASERGFLKDGDIYVTAFKDHTEGSACIFYTCTVSRLKEVKDND